MLPEDDQAIRALLVKMYEAWAMGNGSAYAACFTEDSDYVTFNGIRLRGRRENAELHDALFRGVLKGTRIAAAVESLASLSDDVALVHTLGTGRKKSRQTYVVVRREGGWQIRSFQNTRLQPLSVWLTRVARRLSSS
jgi:uncharacterized protein (TIGR02246 family)